jgi:mannose-6-phosphate isomerase-like protein (cupin superfamily)
VVRSFAEPLKENAEAGWEHHAIFRGSTPAIDMMSCHAAVLSAGCSPHPPHAHNDEELLIVLDGEAELLIADRPEYEGARAVRVTPGDFAYYPAQQHHTIRNPANSPVTYMMFRWNRHTPARLQPQLPTKLFRAPPAPEPQQGKGFSTRRFVEGPTHWLRKLHCHTTRLEAGAGYAAHADDYDVAILVRSGRVRTLGREVGPGGFIYYPAGEIHGMQNVGNEPAMYIVFEFHGAPVTVQNASATATLHSSRALQ